MTILTELLDKSTVTASYLANLLDVSTRTIYRDIDELSLCGVPVFCTKGKGGGICIGEEYKLKATLFSRSEMEFLRNMQNDIDNEQDKQRYHNIISKINSVNTPANYKISSSSLYIEQNSLSQSAIANKITILESAINECYEVSISYIGRNQTPTSRIIRPLNFVLNDNEWYIYCYCTLKNNYRTFKLSRITKLITTKNKFKPIADYPKQWQFEWKNNDPTVSLILQVEEKVLYDVEEWLGIESIDHSNNGKYIAKSTQTLNDALIYKLLSFGDGISVLEPTEVKTKLKEIIDSIKLL